MQIGIDSFAALFPDPGTGQVPPPTERMASLLDEIETADRVGIDVFGIGEHHRAEFLDSAPAVILAAAAARTKQIRLTCAVSVLSAADPVRVFQEYATLDLLSQGRAEMVVGRGSFGEAFPLFGFDTRLYDELFAEKLDLLLKLGRQTHISWQGRFRPALTGQGVYPRPHQPQLPIWLGVGGTPGSFIRAGELGLPLMVAIIGGSFERFKPLIDLYRQAGEVAGHGPEKLTIGIHALGFVGETDAKAGNEFYPGWAHLMATIGHERGWSAPSREQFDTLAGPSGAFIVGDPKTVVQKMLHANKVLGGISRISLQMSTAAVNRVAMNQSIELLGTDVAPMVRAALRQ